MKTAIRKGVFETNSSNTHSFAISSEDMYEKWLKGEVYFVDNFHTIEDKSINGLYTLEEIAKMSGKTIEEFIKEVFEEGNYDYTYYKSNKDNTLNEALLKCIENALAENYNIYTYDKVIEIEWAEIFKEKYTTPKGEEVVVFGFFGYDG